MSRLRRLRSWWLSLYLPRRPASQTKRHRDLFSSQEDYYEWRERHRTARCLLDERVQAILSDYRDRHADGMWTRSASIGTKALGTRTRETATTAGCSSSCPPGAASEDGPGPISSRLESSFIGPSSSGDVTGDLGGSGAPLDSAG